MTGYEVSVGKDSLPGLLSGPESLAKVGETALNQVRETQMTEHRGAAPHERSPERQGYRNGVRLRMLYTRVGPVTLQVPQTREADPPGAVQALQAP
jgi:transposase-like protein